MTDNQIDPRPLTPWDRAKEGEAGVPVKLADGETWLLCDDRLCPEMDTLRDRIYDDVALSGEVDGALIAEAAIKLLQANYDIFFREAMGLVAIKDIQPLFEALWEAMFGPSQPRRTYTTWATSSLLANGIDPGSVPVHLRPHVLEQLVRTRRAIPAVEYIESTEAARKIAAARARAATRAVPEAAPIPAEGGQVDG